MAAPMTIFPLGSKRLKVKDSVIETPDLELMSIFCGSKNSGKTSLLFQAAVSLVTDGLHVTFICKQSFSQLPLHVHGMPTPEPAVLQQLKIVYLSSTQELLQYLASIHSLPLHPDVLIIDDIHHYTGQIQDHGPENAVAKVCAAIKDAACYLQSKSGTHHCHAVLSTAHVIPPILNVYSKFIKDIWLLQGDLLGQTDAILCKPFNKRKNHSQAITYTIGQECITLGKVYVDS